MEGRVPVEHDGCKQKGQGEYGSQHNASNEQPVVRCLTHTPGACEGAVQLVGLQHIGMMSMYKEHAISVCVPAASCAWQIVLLMLIGMDALCLTPQHPIMLGQSLHTGFETSVYDVKMHWKLQ